MAANANDLYGTRQLFVWFGEPAEVDRCLRPVVGLSVNHRSHCRLLDDALADDVPVHLGLPRPKPLLGLDEARRSPTVVIAEGSFDYLTLRMWATPWSPHLALTPGRTWSARCAHSAGNFLVLDNDDAGLEATLMLQQQRGDTAIPVALPNGIKDPSELATRRRGQDATVNDEDVARLFAAGRIARGEFRTLRDPTDFDDEDLLIQRAATEGL